MQERSSQLNFSARLKVKGGFLVATLFLTLVDFLYWWLPRVFVLRRRRRPAGRLVFRVRD
uniref:Uncharacterized protein n=1 Tax=Ammonifex degensii TaxID=42838 RepID=A0A7C1JFC6_9THEO